MRLLVLSLISLLTSTAFAQTYTLTFESTGVYRYTWDYIGGTQGHRMGMAIRCIEN